MADIEQKYYAFLSCSPEDNREAQADSPQAGRRGWGHWLEAAVKAYAIPPEFVGQINGRGEIIPERIAAVFRDESELSESASLSEEIRHALEQSNCLIVICSPRSAQSRQVNAVVSYFKQLGRGNRILPFVIAGAPNANNGLEPGTVLADECYVPALRHPVTPDGTLDTTRLAGKHIFVDARYGVEKREVLAQDHRAAAAELERAKIQLISLLIGVGFDGLWEREQRQHFLELATAQGQAHQALNQVAEVRRQLQEAEHQTREFRKQALEQQNLPRAVQEQIQEAQGQALTAQQQAREAQQQLRESQNKVQETQAQLEEALRRAQAAESKALEAQQSMRETQSQLEATRLQARVVQEQTLEVQGRTQAELAQEMQNQILNAQQQARESQQQLQEVQNTVRETQAQLEEARHRALAAESKVLETQQAVRESQNQLEATQLQARTAQEQTLEVQARTQAERAQEMQNQILNAQREAQSAQSQLEETRLQAQEVQNKFLAAQNQVQEFQNQAQAAQSQLTAARQQVREAQSKVVAAENQTREARNQVQETQKQTRDAQSQLETTQDQIRSVQDRDRTARRLTKVFAVLATLALLGVGVVVRNAGRQRELDRQSLAKAAAESSGKFELATNGVEQIRQLLQNLGGAEQAENRRRSLDRLATGISPDEIPDVLNAASVLVDAQQRSYFQKVLLVRLGGVNPEAAMTNASKLEGKIVNDQGEVDSSLYFQLVVLDHWLQTDWPAAFNWVCQLPDAADRQRALDKITRSVQSQPDSESKNQLLVNCIGELAKTDVFGALAVTESLPSDARFNVRIACLWTKAAPLVVRRLGLPPEIMASRIASWPWPISTPDANASRPALAPERTEAVATNGPVQAQPQE